MIEAAKNFYPYIPVGLILKDKYKNNEKIKNINIPVLVMHGEIDQMNSHNENFALYFKTREKAVLARGENSNYINDFPKDLYIYNYKTKESLPLISYEWFPKTAKYFLQDYNFPVFPDDFAYYLLKDNKTLVMISAVKSLKANFKFDIIDKKLELYPANGKFAFIISSIDV